MTDAIEIEIDGNKYPALPSQTVIQVADENGVYIPRFCYHKHLSIPANCRMCLVEVEKAPKALPACATPVAPGMKVFTKSQKTIDAQRAVMSFLLINHPLDCPICDQGGECELQDLTMGYASPHSHYDQAKHCVADQDLGPLIATDMTRCITCTRCVRFGDEVAGFRELGAMGRGEDTDISTYVTRAIHSEISGNIIDICPVGALTSKPYRFTARAWELNQAPSISPHDCLGSNLNIHTRYGKVMRVVARENTALNLTWISDRDRFSYTGIDTANRLLKPMVKVHGEWQEVDWEEALQIAAASLHGVLDTHGGETLAGLISPTATLEESYLFQRIVRDLGSPHIDHRVREIDTSDQEMVSYFPGFDPSIHALSDLAAADAFVLVGCDLPKEVPLLSIFIREAVKKGAIVIVVNAMNHVYPFTVTTKKILAPSLWSDALHDNQVHFAALKLRKNIHIILGQQALHHPDASLLRARCSGLAKTFAGHLSFITDGGNAAGAWLAGAVPHRLPGGAAAEKVGDNAYQFFKNPKKAYCLFNIAPDLDTTNPAQTKAALQQAEVVIAFSLYQNPVLLETANVLLPISPFTETAGTFVNGLGQWQTFKGVASSESEARPAWKVLRVLAEFLHLNEFAYKSAEEVRRECHSLVEQAMHKKSREAFMHVVAENQAIKTHEENAIYRLGVVPLYSSDSIVRASIPLQETARLTEKAVDCVYLHSKTASRLQLHAGDAVVVTQGVAEATLPLALCDELAEETAWVAGGILSTTNLGDLMGMITVKKA